MRIVSNATMHQYIMLVLYILVQHMLYIGRQTNYVHALMEYCDTVSRISEVVHMTRGGRVVSDPCLIV